MSEKFPVFWDNVEVELNTESEDLCEAKSVFSCLGYLTKSSIASIKTKKKIDALEIEYSRIRCSEKKFQVNLKRYPALEEIDEFTPGLKAIMFQIVSHLNRSENPFEDANLKNEYRNHISIQAEKACGTKPKIIVERGTHGGEWVGKVECPKCKRLKVLSQFVNDTTGRVTFNINNFKRHLNSTECDAKSVLSQMNSLSISPSVVESPCQSCKQLEHTNNSKMSDLIKIIGEKDAEIQELHSEIRKLQKSLNTKHNKFDIQLCLFEPIISSEIEVKDNSVRYIDSTNVSRCLYFDRIFEGPASKEKFEGVTPYLDSFLNGESVCVFTHGVTGGGKSCTMFGIEDDIGLLCRSAAYIMTKKSIIVEAIELYGNDRFDMLDKGKIITQKPTEMLIESNDGFSFIAKGLLLNRKQKPTDENVTSSRSHLLIIISTSEHPENKLVFVDLAGFEKLNGKENVPETKFINSTLSNLNTVLLNISRNQTASFKSSILTRELEPYLKTCARILMLYHLPLHSAKKGLEYIKDVVASRKFFKQNASASNIASKSNVLRKIDTDSFNTRQR